MLVAHFPFTLTDICESIITEHQASIQPFCKETMMSFYCTVITKSVLSLLCPTKKLIRCCNTCSRHRGVLNRTAAPKAAKAGSILVTIILFYSPLEMFAFSLNTFNLYLGAV